MEANPRPECCKDEHLEFLYEMKEQTSPFSYLHMRGACYKLKEKFQFTSEEAKDVLMFWLFFIPEGK